MSANVQDLVRAAGSSAQAGRWDEAERLWHQVLELEPQHPQALYSLGIHALRRQDGERAFELLVQASGNAPADLTVLMALTAACRLRGDAEAEMEAIETALAADAYFLPALLAKGSWLERHRSASAAAPTYSAALKVAPPEPHWPEALRPQLQQARRALNRYSQALGAHFASRMAGQLAALPDVAAARWQEAMAIASGQSTAYPSRCNQLYVPRLPAIPFFDRLQFPALRALEDKTEEIRAELMAALEADREQFSPYIAYKPGEPVNQWKELNHSLRWSAYHLWRSGVPVTEHLERCPLTAEALTACGLVDIDGMCPNAMFSALAPKTHIPPHHGETNARLVAHLPLIVPDGCRFRVGFEQRTWEVGEMLVFDDTIEHEAWNGSDELRVVLIIDLWNPLVSPQEREMVNAIVRAHREFSASF